MLEAQSCDVESYSPRRIYSLERFTMTSQVDFEPEAAQIRVTFTTKEEDVQLEENQKQLMVPAGEFTISWRSGKFSNFKPRYPALWVVSHSQFRVFA